MRFLRFANFAICNALQPIRSVLWMQTTIVADYLPISALVPKYVLSPTGPLDEPIERLDTAYKSPTQGEREGAKIPQKTFEMEHGTPFPWPRKSMWPGLLWK